MVKYKIEIDRDTCIGDRVCGDEAPETFHVDAEGKGVVVDPEGDPPENILRAAKKCPNGAITLLDAATGHRVWPEGV